MKKKALDSQVHPVICVRHRDGWCKAKNQKNFKYSDHIKTACNHVITLPLGIEYRQPDCIECLKS